MGGLFLPPMYRNYRISIMCIKNCFLGAIKDLKISLSYFFRGVLCSSSFKLCAKVTGKCSLTATHQKSCRHKKWFASYAVRRSMSSSNTQNEFVAAASDVLHTPLPNTILKLCATQSWSSHSQIRSWMNKTKTPFKQYEFPPDHDESQKAFKTNLSDRHMRSMKSSKLLSMEYIRKMFYIPINQYH